jgi:hypothetical protein
MAAAADRARPAAAARLGPARLGGDMRGHEGIARPGDARRPSRAGGRAWAGRPRGASAAAAAVGDQRPRAPARDQRRGGLGASANSVPGTAARPPPVDIKRGARMPEQGRRRSALPGLAGARRRSAAANRGEAAISASSASVRLPSSAIRPVGRGAVPAAHPRTGAGSRRPRPPANGRRQWRRSGRSPLDRHVAVGRQIVRAVDQPGLQPHPLAGGTSSSPSGRGRWRSAAPGAGRTGQRHRDVHRHPARQPGDAPRHVRPQPHRGRRAADDVPQDRADAQDVRCGSGLPWRDGRTASGCPPARAWPRVGSCWGRRTARCPGPRAFR